MSAEITKELAAEYKALAEDITKAKAEIGKVLFGMDDAVTKVLTCMISGGHALLVGMPGVAKTTMFEALAQVTGLQNSRIQFTPELMPSDIVGSIKARTNSEGKREEYYDRGPIFAQFVLADEINRASPRTQSAMLQAMQEGKVTVDKETHALPQPMIIMATQNPLEQEGTYPLPEAQRDRFMMQVDVDYPSAESEYKIAASAKASFRNKSMKLEQVLSYERILRAQELIDMMPISEDVVKHIVHTVRKARPTDPSATAEVKDAVTWAPGPRAEQMLVLASKARALMDGRLSPSIDDVNAMLEPIMKPRMALSYSRREEWQKVMGSLRPR